MVLQQQTDVKLWGQAQAKATLTVKTSWNNKTYKAVADNKGLWELQIPTPQAGGPYEITFNDGEPFIKLGSLETMVPISFRNQPVGCTATILYEMYGEQKQYSYL